MLLWTRRMQFWHARRKIFDKRPNIFGSASKIDLKSINFAEKLFSSNWTFEHIEFSFANPAKKNIHQTAKNFSLTLQEGQKKILLFLKVLLMTKRRQFWQRRRKFFDKSQSIFVHCPSKKVRNSFLQKVISLTMVVLQTLRTQFWQKHQTFSPRRRKLFAQEQKDIWRYETFPEMNVSSNCSQGHVEGSSDNPAGNVLPGDQKIFT